MIVESCIDNINNMLFAAFAHGGDLGGPYGSESEWMKQTIENFLTRYNLINKYEYKECDRKKDNCHYFKVPQIVKKETIKEVKYGEENIEEQLYEHCDAYVINYDEPRCLGTKEMDICDCEGNKYKCSFYNLTSK